MMKCRRVILFGLGICGLCAGLLEYITARPLNSAYLLNHLSAIISYLAFMPDIYGWLGQWVADFLHVFSFSLISISLFSQSRNSRVFFCSFWLGINILFEIGQAYGVQIARYIPFWLDRISVLGNARGYFANGRFDVIDIAAFILGAIVAFLISELIISGKVGYKPIKMEVRRYA